MRTSYDPTSFTSDTNAFPFVSYFRDFQLDVYRFLDFNKLTQWFSDFSTHKNHLEAFMETLLLPTPNPNVFYFICVGET